VSSLGSENPLSDWLGWRIIANPLIETLSQIVLDVFGSLGRITAYSEVTTWIATRQRLTPPGDISSRKSAWRQESRRHGPAGIDRRFGRALQTSRSPDSGVLFSSGHFGLMLYNLVRVRLPDRG
jgi:hypothetical protein